MTRHTCFTAAAAVLSLTAAAPALADSEIEELRALVTQLQQDYAALRNDYEARIQDLETRLAKAEAKAPEPAPRPTAPAASAGNAFNPSLSLILDGKFAQLSRDPDGYAIPGFPLAGETGPGDRGFSLGESELVASANIDDKFYGRLTAALAPEGGVEVEEAYLETLGLGQGLTARAGRFYSGVGYMNEQHPHQWDFVDTALPYRALLGNQYGDDGVQLRWLAPTDQFVEFGAELLRGDAYPAAGAADKGKGAWSVFAHTGGDVGASHSWRAGLSYLHAESQDRETGTSPDLFTGTSKLVLADLVWKWAPNGNPYRTNFTLQTEYIQRDEDGDFNGIAYSGTQRGWYVQGVYQFMPRWRIGLRHDALDADAVPAALAGTELDSLGHTPRRNSVMVDFANSEYSRFRIQYNRDESQPDIDHQWYLQYVVSLGAHGAHKF